MRKGSTRRREKRDGRRAWVAALALSAVLGCAAPARAEHPVIAGTDRGEHPVIAGTSIAFDLIIVRPLSLGELVFGFICFVPAAIVAGPSVADPWDTFVAEPFEATFVRPLGEFEEEY